MKRTDEGERNYCGFKCLLFCYAANHAKKDVVVAETEMQG